MSNAKRPSVARKVTPKDEAARTDALNRRMDLRIDGTVYSIVPADLNGLVEARVRRETGLSVNDIFETLDASPGIDMLAYFMFAAELAAGRDADLNSILESISYASEVEKAEPEEAAPFPQP